MWGYPHIPVGRRVERPIQCRLLTGWGQLSAISAFGSGPIAGNHNTEAPSYKPSEQLRSELCYHDYPSAQSFGLALSAQLKQDLSRAAHSVAAH